VGKKDSDGTLDGFSEGPLEGDSDDPLLLGISLAARTVGEKVGWSVPVGFVLGDSDGVTEGPVGEAVTLGAAVGNFVMMLALPPLERLFLQRDKFLLHFVLGVGPSPTCLAARCCSISSSSTGRCLISPRIPRAASAPLCKSPKATRKQQEIREILMVLSSNITRFGRKTNITRFGRKLVGRDSEKKQDLTTLRGIMQRGVVVVVLVVALAPKSIESLQL
jgi:hypothetical protein